MPGGSEHPFQAGSYLPGCTPPLRQRHGGDDAKSSNTTSNERTTRPLGPALPGLDPVVSALEGVAGQ